MPVHFCLLYARALRNTHFLIATCSSVALEVQGPTKKQRTNTEDNSTEMQDVLQQGSSSECASTSALCTETDLVLCTKSEAHPQQSTSDSALLCSFKANATDLTFCAMTASI
jgi:hypothetical protein